MNKDIKEVDYLDLSTFIRTKAELVYSQKEECGILMDEEMTITELQELMDENEKFLLNEIKKMKKEKKGIDESS